MKRFLIILLSILGVIALVIGGFAIYMTQSMTALKQYPLQGLNAAELADGTYEGSYDAGRWANRVSLTVKDGKIEDIQILKTVTFEDKKVTDDLFHQVIQKQSTDVDIMTGATITSKAYLKSIEDALTK